MTSVGETVPVVRKLISCGGNDQITYLTRQATGLVLVPIEEENRRLINAVVNENLSRLMANDGSLPVRYAPPVYEPPKEPKTKKMPLRGPTFFFSGDGKDRSRVAYVRKQYKTFGRV